MPRPSAQEFLLEVLEAIEDLPPELARRLAEIVKTRDADRSQALRQLFEEFTRE